jgi:hypothetical protein
MTPEQQAQVLIEDFNDIVNDTEKAKECSIYFIEKMFKIDDFVDEWWREVMKCVKQY